MFILIFFAFLSGIVTILSPCILPILPIVLSGSVGGKRRPFGVILGFIISFSVFTLALTALVRLLNIPPDALRVAAVVLLIVFGLVMTVPRLMTIFEIFASRMTGHAGNSKPSTGLTGGILVGFSLGLVWTPCVGPIMASVISLAITQSIDGGTVFIILAYSLGTSIPMLSIMLGGRKLIKRFPALSKNTGKIQQIFGVLLIVVGLSIAFGIDRKFQSAVLDIFPEYGAGLTVFENIDPVQNAIKARKETPSGPLSFEIQPKNAILGDYGMAPAIVTTGEWLNTDGQALTMADLKGKVVIIDFWTYSCINCVRTIPHLQSWYDAYKDDGLVIIGVHTPEFAFERTTKNVREAMTDLGVSWPVVLDNDYDQWQAYNNRYWPAEYFIDAEGRIRYFHFGEGKYETSEKVIRKLLAEAGVETSKKAVVKEEVDIQSRTAETYLGFSRTEGFISDQEIIRYQPAEYTRTKSPDNGEWAIEGAWTFNSEYILSEEMGTLELGFYAKNVYLVIEPGEIQGAIEVYIDGNKGQDTADVINGILQPDGSRLYQLVSLKKAGKHILKLKVKGEMRLFAFTFG
ncbi:MAG: cytochrome c biogenesis protein DipZ [Spirochaetaceae bacterium]|jgi:cytochrome c biogenesis protein CcdA/thiol-disulfide isomerase/thioredoxin|nr:cytochrome c biogenesis protein DipZ [Spirochaetaceae bacterium]